MNNEILFTDSEEQAYSQTKGNIEEFPDGEYTGLFASVNLVNVKGRRTLILKYQIETPEDFAGAEKAHFINLENPKIYWLVKRDMASFGIGDDVRLVDLPVALLEPIGRVVNFTLETNGKYQNVKIKSVYEKSAQPESLSQNEYDKALDDFDKVDEDMPY